MLIVIKRDGRKEEFDKERILKAVQRSFKSVDGEVTDKARIKSHEIANAIAEQVSDGTTVEEIQDLVEKKLMNSQRKDVARAFVTYRDERSRIREGRSALLKIIREKLSASNIQNQNANVDEASFGGRRGEADSELMKKIALDDCMSEMARNNHLNNEIYIHDLDSYAVGCHNCLTVPFDDLLKNGFNTRQTDVRPANSINTAFQLIAVIFQIQSLMQFGGVAASHLDHTMVPYVQKSFAKHFRDGVKYIKKDEEYAERVPKILSFDDPEANDYRNKEVYKYAMDMTERETYQAVEGMYHNLNTLQSRSGNQLPFTSINYGTCILPEGRLIIRALLEGSLKGVGKLHKTPIFPCGIFQLMKGVNREPGDPNYDLYQLALESTARRLYPNYANIDWSGNAGYDRNDPRTYFATMG